MVVVGVLLVLARGLVLLRDVMIAAHYGVGSVVDAFNIAFTIVSWPSQVIISVMTVSLVPLLIRLSGEEKNRPRSDLIAELNGSIALLSILIGVAIYLLRGFISDIFSHGLDDNTSKMIETMLLWFSPLACLMIYAGYLGARLQSIRDNMFTLAEGLPSLLVLIMIVFTVMNPGSDLIFGILLGTCLQILLLIFLLQRRGERIGSCSFRRTSSQWSALYPALGVVLIGQFLLGAALPLDQYFLSKFGDGQVAHFGYATRVVNIISTAGSTIIARVLLPSFSQMLLRGDQARARNHSIKWSILFAVVGILGSVIVAVFSSFIISTLFERGSFVSADTLSTSSFVKILIFQVPFFLSGQVLVQWMGANGLYFQIFIITIIALSVKVAMVGLVFYGFGINIILFSGVVFYLITFLLLVGYVALFVRAREDVP